MLGSLHFSQTVDGVNSYFTTIAIRITVYNSVEIHQMSDSTGILHESTAIVLVFCNIIYLIG